MLVKATPGYAFGTKLTSRVPPRREMVVVVRAGYTLRPGEPVAVRTDLRQAGYLSGDVFGPDDEDRTGALVRATDFADHKLKVDLLLKATCWPGEGRRAQECTVTFRVGSWSKSAQVFGRRVWTERPLDPISTPAPFVSMPLGWATSFGGPGFAANPAGKGFGDGELPCVERPGALLQSRRDRPPSPVGFGPVSPAWLPRCGKEGKEYGASWRKTRSPFFAADFDWSSFNAAPVDQQLDRDLRGDEELGFEHLHPDAPSFTARLPGVRPRAFVRFLDGKTHEALLRLDTLLADVDAGLLFLTWRGHAPVAEDDFADVRTLLVGVEPIDAPTPESAWSGRVDALEKDPLGMKDAVPEDVRKKVDAALAARASPPAPVAMPDLAQNPSNDAVFDVTRAQTVRALADRSPAEQAQALDLVERLRTGTAQAQASIPSAAPGAPPGPPDPFAMAIERLQAQRAASPDPDDMQRIDDSIAQIAQAQQSTAAAEASASEALSQSTTGVTLPTPPAQAGAPPTLALPGDKVVAPGPGARLVDRDFAGQDLSGKNLSGALLRGANLSGAKLSGADLSRVDLSGASLEGADLSGANLSRANLTGVHAKGAFFGDAVLAQTIFSGAVLEGALFAGARVAMSVFMKADATGASFKGAHLTKAFFSGGKLDRADFSESHLDTCIFTDVSAVGAVFDRSRLEKVAFLKCTMRGASFTEARGKACSWQGTKLESASFRGVDMPRAHFIGAVLTDADLTEALLVGARFYRARLQRAQFVRANLCSADLSKAELGETRFAASNLYDAKFFGAKASAPCDFAGASSAEARWEQS